MNKILAALKAGYEGVKNVATRWTEKTAATMAVGYVLSVVHAKHPDWILPSDKEVMDFAGMLVSVHTGRELWSAIKYAFAMYVQLNKGAVEPPK